MFVLKQIRTEAKKGTRTLPLFTQAVIPHQVHQEEEEEEEEEKAPADEGVKWQTAPPKFMVLCCVCLFAFLIAVHKECPRVCVCACACASGTPAKGENICFAYRQANAH